MVLITKIVVSYIQPKNVVQNNIKMHQSLTIVFIFTLCHKEQDWHLGCLLIPRKRKILYSYNMFKNILLITQKTMLIYGDPSGLKKKQPPWKFHLY